MKTMIPISDARRRLPRLVKQLQRDPGMVYTITVRDEAVAELRAVGPGAKPGLAARKLLELLATLPKPRRKARTNVAEHINDYVYGKAGAVK